jgi:uncharacterized protein YrrD
MSKACADGTRIAPPQEVKEASMVFKATDLEGAPLAAIDGAIGEVVDCFFDDQQWTVRYLVVDTGGWLSGRKVLISPASVRDVDVANRRVVVILTRKQVEDSPDVDTHQPIPRRQESALLAYYGIPPYWLAADPLVPALLPVQTVPAAATEGASAREDVDDEDAHLHSTRDVIGYEIQARDGAIGSVRDFLIDDQSWTLRWVVVDTGNWMPGKQVLVSPEWVEAVAWPDRAVRVSLTREQIQNAPEYDPDAPLQREYERSLFEHYRRPSYWRDAA